MVNKKGKITLS